MAKNILAKRSDIAGTIPVTLQLEKYWHKQLCVSYCKDSNNLRRRLADNQSF